MHIDSMFSLRDVSAAHRAFFSYIYSETSLPKLRFYDTQSRTETKQTYLGHSTRSLHIRAIRSSRSARQNGHPGLFSSQNHLNKQILPNLFGGQQVVANGLHASALSPYSRLQIGHSFSSTASEAISTLGYSILTSFALLCLSNTPPSNSGSGNRLTTFCQIKVRWDHSIPQA